jgi:outer membrane protein assembly factor BamE (lipoprotein component of BamABCDE complex)
MIHNSRNNFWVGLITAVVIVTALLLVGATVAGAQSRAVSTGAHTAAPQQPLYSEYRGVRIGMTAKEVRTKLGEPMQPGDDMDFYVFSDKEAAQIVYDAAQVVKIISVDYVGGVGAPDYKSVVGPDIEVRADGSLYRQMHYDSFGIWVFYNRGAGDAATVTITIQKSPFSE